MRLVRQVTNQTDCGIEKLGIQIVEPHQVECEERIETRNYNERVISS